MTLFKVVQKKVYDVLSSRQALLLCFLCLVLLLISAFHFGQALLEWSQEQYQSIFISYRDNIVEKNLQSRLCQFLPIDAVYTWVNGSDPKLFSELQNARADFIWNFNTTRDSAPSHCSYSHCVISHFAIMQPVLQNSFLHSMKLKDMRSFNVTGFVKGENLQGKKSFIVLRFKDLHSAKEAISMRKISVNSEIFSISNAFITDDLTTNNGILLKDTYILTPVPNGIQESIIRSVLPHSIEQISLHEEKSIAVITISNTEQTYNLTSLKLIINNKTSSLVPAYLMFTSQNEVEDVASSRFADNEELRYSLRSLIKNAPWIRTVFLVTNGQIPHWLAIDNTRIKIITHEEIFPNKSHLPTFSSPAIESHLHRIPGVSKRFIYLNDDVFFGKPVWPEDFYTESKGHKVYMSWPVPDCADGCPTSWIKDGYCDRPCNNSHCEWDGGDCSGEKVKFSYPQLNGLKPDPSLVMENINKMYCNPSCTNSWLGDRYCDQACNVQQCGFDAGDCGINYFYQLHQLTLSDKTIYKFPPGVAVAFFNLTSFSEEFGSIQSGVYEDVPGIRAVVISVKFKVLTIVLQSNFPSFNLTIVLKSTKNKLRFVVGTENKANVEDSARSAEKLTPIISENFTIHPDRKKPRIIPLDLNPPKLNSSFAAVSHYNITQLEEYFKSGYLTELGFKMKKAKLLKSSTNLFEKIIENESEYFTMKKLRSIEHLSRHYSQTRLGFLPWEKLKLFSKFQKLLSEKMTQDEYMLNSFSNRRLKDTFGDSLRHVNKLYNSYFGYEARKVPAHMAHFIDVDIMNRLHDRFNEEFDATSSHKIRSPTDMQFGFSYYYFLMSEMRNVTENEIFDAFDTDNSGTWSDREIRTLLTRIYDLPLLFPTITNFESIVLNCSQDFPTLTSGQKFLAHERYLDSKLNIVTKDLITQCEPIVKILLEKFGKEQRNLFEIIGEDEVAFKMIHSNLSLVLPHLDDLRKKPKKFVCLNDNIGHGTKNSEMVKAVLMDFYESYFPNPSAFELPPEYRNRFLYVDELRRWQDYKENVRIVTDLIIIFLVATSVISFCASIICSKQKRFGQARRSFLFDNHYTNV